MTSAQVDLKTQTTGSLPVTRGGTNSTAALVNGRLMNSVGGAIVEGTSSSDPSFNSVTVTGLDASKFLITDVAKALAVTDLVGTANRVIVTGQGTQTTTLSLQQDIATTSVPTFSDVVLSGSSIYGGSLANRVYIHAANNDTLVHRTTQTDLKNKTFEDSSCAFRARLDPTKLVCISPSNQTTGTTSTLRFTSAANRVYTVPDPGVDSSVVLTSVLTPSLPAKTNAVNNITSGLINLTSEVTGVLPYANGGSTGVNTGDVSLTTVGAAPNANGASLTGQVLLLQPCSSTFPGILTTGTQDIAGNKSLYGTLLVYSKISTNAANIVAPAAL